MPPSFACVQPLAGPRVPAPILIPGFCRHGAVARRGFCPGLSTASRARTDSFRRLKLLKRAFWAITGLARFFDITHYCLSYPSIRNDDTMAMALSLFSDIDDVSRSWHRWVCQGLLVLSATIVHIAILQIAQGLLADFRTFEKYFRKCWCYWWDLRFQRHFIIWCLGALLSSLFDMNNLQSDWGLSVLMGWKSWTVNNTQSIGCFNYNMQYGFS